MGIFRNDFKRLNSVDRVKYQSLYTAYNKPSMRKREIYEDCIKIAKKVSLMSGYELFEHGLLSHNAQIFTFGMVFRRGDGNGYFEVRIRPSTFNYWLNFIDERYLWNSHAVNNDIARQMYGG